MDQLFMKLAIDLASATSGQTNPNPPVGAVVVKDGSVVGVGCHIKAGEPHAEVHAINMAGNHAEGATIYVTLEPCSHYGRTPPCANLLIEKKISRVVIAIQDDNPNVDGNGIKKLKEAGITVDIGICHEEAKELYKYFFTNIREKRPFVTLKSALSLDGKLATNIGDSTWITGEEARVQVHQERADHDCILIGVGTILHDNPSLTVRLNGNHTQPTRIILDSNLQTPIDAKVTNTIEAKTIIFTLKLQDTKIQPFLDKGIEIVQMNEMRLVDILSTIYEMGYSSLYVEGGNKTHTSFIKENLFDELIIYYAPKIIGQSKHQFFNHFYTNTMQDVKSLRLLSTKQIGQDIRMHFQNEVN